jgi:hypothetical protein
VVLCAEASPLKLATTASNANGLNIFFMTYLSKD